MRRQIAVAICSMAFGLMTLSLHAIAQQKTAKTCQEEWRANKAANKANGVTEKAYVAQCRGGGAPAQTTAVPAVKPAPAAAPKSEGQKTAKDCREEWNANKATNQASGVTEKAYVVQCRGGAPTQTTAVPAAQPAPTLSPATAPKSTDQKTTRDCRDEWLANKAANQANGVTEKAYVAQCRGGAAPAQTTAAPPPPPAPAPTASAPPARPAPASAPTAAPAPTVSANPVGANEFSTVAQAKARCPADTIVWANLPSKIYHFSDTRYYGNTKHGAYMCERDAAAAGMRAAKNETHP